MSYEHYPIERMKVLEGYYWIMGGNSTAYIHQVVVREKRQRPRIPIVHEKACHIIQEYEEKSLGNITNIARNVRNA
jgi:hypothetical protein